MVSDTERGTEGRRLWLAALAALTVAGPVPAFAQDGGDDVAGGRSGLNAGRALDAGAFSAWSMAPRGDTQRGLVHVQGGYDAARKGTAMESVVEARLVGRLSLRAGASYLGPDGKVRPLVAGKLDTLRQDTHGVDLAVAAGYEPHGFNTVPALGVLAAIGGSVGDLSLVGNLGYGMGMEEGEHYGDARLAAFYGLGRAFRLGVDSRLRMDLERDRDEPEGEPDWELVVGPVAAAAAGRFVVSAGAGLSAIRLRLQEETSVGALVHLGLGAVF